MSSLRSDILQQIKRKKAGRIFTCSELSFDRAKAANVFAILSEQVRSGKLARAFKGAYYRPEESLLGLGNVPVSQSEEIAFLTRQTKGYVSGTYAYNRLDLTEQMTHTITIASPNPQRRISLASVNVKFVKAYVTATKENIHLLLILDALKDMKQITGTTPQGIYGKVKNFHIANMSDEEKKKLAKLSLNYPSRVRKCLSDIFNDLGEEALKNTVSATLLPNIRFSLQYKTARS